MYYCIRYISYVYILTLWQALKICQFVKNHDKSKIGQIASEASKVLGTKIQIQRIFSLESSLRSQTQLSIFE